MAEITKKSEDRKTPKPTLMIFENVLGPYVVATETTRMAMVFTDAKEAGDPIIFANDSFLALTGYAREEVLAKSFASLMASGATPEAMKEVAAAFAGADIDPERTSTCAQDHRGQDRAVAGRAFGRPR